MNVIIGAAVASAATHVFDHTLPTVYRKGNELMGYDVFTVEEETEEDMEEDDEVDLTHIAYDPDVGYLDIPMRKKKIPIQQNIQEKKEDIPILSTVEDDDCINDLKILDYIAYVSVAFFILYTSHKILKYSKNSKYNIMDDIYNGY